MWPRRGARTKYAAVPTAVDGIRFASKREAHRYGELVLRLRAGQIGDLACHPEYDIAVGDVHISTYIADFSYVDLATGELVVEDVKGMPTPVFKLKKKLIEALYPFQIREVR